MLHFLVIIVLSSAIFSQSALANSVSERVHLNLSKAMKIIHRAGKCMQPAYNWSASCSWGDSIIPSIMILNYVCSLFAVYSKPFYRAFTNLMFRMLELLTNLCSPLDGIRQMNNKIVTSQLWSFMKHGAFVSYFTSFGCGGILGFVWICIFALLAHHQKYCKFIDFSSSLQSTFFKPC